MATELGKAYVQIIPSAKGIKGQIENVLGGDVDKAGKSAGKSLGSGIASTFKKVIATAGIGTAISTALNEGGKLQQSIGGVETLFKDSAETIKKYASEAYKGAGISANEYMELSTSFAASLLQSLDGNTQAAAEATNTAINDMADNSAKFGSSMESLQQAYAGFSKGQYQLLDNLKLGYGGTKTEMERLLKDAQALTGVKYDINNLSDVYEAIHVIQGEIGLTGSAANEASETFSGSLNSMKAAATNLLGNLALGEDITPSLIALGETVWNFGVNNLIPMMWNIVTGLGGALKDGAKKILSTDTSVAVSVMDSITKKLPDILKKGVEMVTNISNGILRNIPKVLESVSSLLKNFMSFITQNLPTILQKGVEMVTNIANGISQNIPKVLESVGSMLSNFISFIMQNLPTILQAGVKMLTNLAQGISNTIPTIVSTAAKVVSDLLAKFASHLPQLLQQGITMLGQLAAGLIKAIPTLVSKIPTIISNVVSAFKSHDWGSIGKDIIAGVAKGILNGVGSIVSAAKEAASSAFTAAKKKLGIESPSKVMRDGVGRWIPAGIAVGIEKNSSMVTSAMEELTKEATGTVNASVAMGIGQSSNGKLATSGNNAQGGFQQNVNIYSPRELSPSEVARQTRNATRNMVLSLQGA